MNRKTCLKTFNTQTCRCLTVNEAFIGGGGHGIYNGKSRGPVQMCLSIPRLELPLATTERGWGRREGGGERGGARLERADLREGKGGGEGGCIAYYRMCAINVHA